MKKIFQIIGLFALVAVAASCSKSRAEQMKLAENVKVACNPEVLTLVGDKIPAEVTVTYPAEYFYPKATLEVTPVLVYEGGEIAGKTYTYQGEKVTENNKVVAYKQGGSVKESLSFDYVPGVEKSYLELRSVAYFKGKPIEIPAIKVADGCNVTQNLVNKEGYYSFKKDAYQAVIHEKAEGQIMYDYNSAEVKKSELRSESVKELQAALQEIANDARYTVKGTKIVAYASPEGGQKYNAKLSDKRAASADKAWSKVTDGFKADNVEIQSMGQDWEGFQEAIQNSKIEDKDLILRVLSMYSDPAVRESEIRNMSQVYTEIDKNVFPELRRARFITEADYQNFSDAELEELSRKAVDVLDEEGLLRVAANSDKADRKAEIYKLAVSKFGSDRARFNLAVLALNDGSQDKAAGYLDDIKEADGDVTNALGVCELRNGNLDKAAALFKKAGTADSKANLGVIDILKGNYATAAEELAGSKGYNRALAFVLDGKLDNAAKALTCSCPKSNYIRAIIAARKGNSADVTKYLGLVADKSSALKTRSEKDVEFANYR